MAPQESNDFFFYEDQPNCQSRRYSQSHVSSTTFKDSNQTAPYRRNRSFSTSSIDPSTLAAHIITSVNNKLKEEVSEFDCDEICEVTKAILLGAKRLLHIEELPKDRRENQYVLSGYRFYKSKRDCLKSLFSLHNETVNIWSHLLGFIFFSFLSINLFQRKFPDASGHDLFIFAAFCVAALLCLLCSSIYHTFICHSAHHIKSLTATLDYIGITFLITASICTIVHFGFYCDPVSRNRYLIFSTLIGSIGVILPFFRFFDTKRYRPLRIGLFVIMAFSSVVPVLHLITVKGLVHSFDFLKPALLGGLMYVCGVTVYAKRFPEKFFPGRFDFTGMTSHAIWHIFVCLGILFHYIGSFHFYNRRESYGCMVY